jgi:hypothetical protein
MKGRIVELTAQRSTKDAIAFGNSKRKDSPTNPGLMVKS